MYDWISKINRMNEKKKQKKSSNSVQIKFEKKVNEIKENETIMAWRSLFWTRETTKCWRAHTHIKKKRKKKSFLSTRPDQALSLLSFSLFHSEYNSHELIFAHNVSFHCVVWYWLKSKYTTNEQMIFCARFFSLSSFCACVSQFLHSYNVQWTMYSIYTFWLFSLNIFFYFVSFVYLN